MKVHSPKSYQVIIIYQKIDEPGGVVAIHIQWICNLDFDFEENCLPKWVLDF